VYYTQRGVRARVRIRETSVCATARIHRKRVHTRRRRHGTRKRRNRFSLSPRSPRFAHDGIISLRGRSTAELLHGNSISRYASRAGILNRVVRNIFARSSREYPEKLKRTASSAATLCRLEEKSFHKGSPRSRSREQAKAGIEERQLCRKRIDSGSNERPVR